MPGLRPPLATPFNVFGDAATVTPVGGAPIAMVVVRVGPQAPNPSILMDPEVANRPRFRLRRDQVATLPLGSTIQVTEGPEAGTWIVDRVDDSDSEQLEAVVHA